jgi:hypothetical protein
LHRWRVAGFLALSLALASSVAVSQEPLFIRGDCNADAATGEWVTEAIFLLGFLFQGEVDSLPCAVACDANGDGALDLSDAVYTLAFAFQGGPSPPEPYPDCGLDPGAGDPSGSLGCARPPLGCQPAAYCPEQPPDDLVEQPFQRGDFMGQGYMDFNSGIYLLNWLRLGGPAPLCLDAADMNDDGCVDLADVLMLPPVCALWLGLSWCPELGPCKEDETPDFLGCNYSPCAGR